MYLTGDFVPQKTMPVVPDFGDEWIVTNLEGPVCKDDTPRNVKVGIHLHSAPFSISGNWVFALANNHIMDYGESGLIQTVEFLNARRKTDGTKWCGAGRTEALARRHTILEENGMRIAVISCCERQFGVAGETCPGVAEKGVWLYSAIEKLKADVDFVVVSCHCASEFSTAINPRLQQFYHSLIDAGADVVHGHHSHVPQGWEEYRGRPIFYGLGNFVVDTDSWQANPHYKWSLIANVKFAKSGIKWNVQPHGDIPANVSSYIDMANRGFFKPELLTALWQDSCVRLYHKIYEQNLRAPSVENSKMSARARMKLLYFSVVDFWKALRGRELPSDRSLFYARVLYNYFNCESHVDVINTALGVLTGSIPDERGRLDK